MITPKLLPKLKRALKGGADIALVAFKKPKILSAFAKNSKSKLLTPILRDIVTVCSITNLKIERAEIMSVIKITTENFNQEVANSTKPILLDFYADWCGPCQMVSPIVEEIAEEYPQYDVGKINVDEQPSIAENFGIMSIPALFVVKEGKIVAQSIGALPKEEIIKMFD